MEFNYTAELILRYIEVFLRWPPIVLALGLSAIFLFKKPISNVLSRVTTAGGYGFMINATSSQGRVEPAKIPESPELVNAIEQQKPELKKDLPLIPDEAIQYVKNNPEVVIEEYLRVFNGYRYERALNLIYGTQMDILTFLISKGTDGEAYTNLAIFYEEFRKRAPEANYQMPDYIRFLQNLGFIEYFGAEPNLRVRITPSGLGFLSYVRNEYPAVYDKRPF